MATPARARPAPQLKITVTAEHIEQAIPKDSSHCMIAEAIKASHPEFRQIAVDLATIRFSDPTAGKRYIYLTPRTAQVALLDFDRARKPDPFEFTVRAAQVVPMRVGTNRNYEAKKLGSTNASGKVPLVNGGELPPMGPLSNRPRHAPAADARAAARATTEEGAVQSRRTGRRREFGLRAMG